MKIEKKDIIIALMLLVSVAFELIPKWGTDVSSSYFPLMKYCHNWEHVYRYPIKWDAYVYFGVEKILAICYVMLLLFESRWAMRYRVLLMIVLFHTVDYFFTFNLVYTWIWAFPLSANTLGFLFFSVYLADSYARRIQF